MVERSKCVYRRLLRLTCAVTSSCLIFSAHSALAASAILPAGFTDTPVAGSLDEPVGLARVPDAPSRVARVLFIEQRTARVRMSIAGVLTTLGTVPGVRSVDTEKGLLGIAVDPDFPAAPYIYIHATDNRFGSFITISRFTLTGDLGYSGAGALAFDPASRYDLIRNLPDNAINHNGGTVRFGLDRTLYVSLGDDENNCNAQLVTVLAGKILRLDVSRLPPGSGGPAPYALLTAPGNPYASNSDSLARLVWASGLRNPFRFHVDALNGELFVADVGEGTWEELTRFSAGGQNGGWPWREANASFIACSGSLPAVASPIASYNHTEGVVIISAGIYRRPAAGTERFPLEYDGNCFFLDYDSGMMRRLTGSGGSWTAAPAVAGQPNSNDWAAGMESVSDVLALPDGSLLYVRQSIASAALTGEIRRIAHPTILAVGDATAHRVSFALPRPTPSRERVVLEWSQREAGAVRLTIYDTAGRSIRMLARGATFAPGTHAFEWNGTDASGVRVAPGLYLARLVVGHEIRHARIMLLR